MRALILALAFSLPAQAALADLCDDLMAAFHVPPPPRDVRNAPGIDLNDCTRDELAMFQKNLAAIARAAPVADPAELHGTWLGDDVLGPVAGLTVAGQEVLRIAPGAEPGTLDIRQDWVKAVLPNGQPLPFTPEAGYTGWLARGTLHPETGRKGGYAPGDAPFTYSGRTFEFERSWDLSVKYKLNYFDLPLTFLRDGDTLVLRYAYTDPWTREETENTVTFTRVADDAPDIAILLVAALEQSQTRSFDCFTHQLSDGQGALIDAFAPLSPDEAVQLIWPVVAFGIERDRLIRMPDADRDADWQAEIEGLMERQIAHTTDPDYRSLLQRIFESDLGCPSLF